MLWLQTRVTFATGFISIESWATFTITMREGGSGVTAGVMTDSDNLGPQAY